MYIVLSLHATYVDYPPQSLPTLLNKVSKCSHDVLRLHYTRAFESTLQVALDGLS